MKRKLISIIYIILIIAVILLAFRSALNAVLINKYNNGIYDEDLARLLTNFSFGEEYVARYNLRKYSLPNG